MGVRSADDYLQQLRALLPPGPAWERDFAPKIDALLQGAAAELARIDRRAADLLDEADPVRVRELVPDWERAMGLPDPCLGPLQMFEGRQGAVRERLLAVGEQRPAYYIAIAVKQGYPNAFITEHRAPRFGRSRFGAARWGQWRANHSWTLHTGGRLRGGRRFGISHWGERFGANPADGLYCLINRYAPAHTVVHIDYEEI